MREECQISLNLYLYIYILIYVIFIYINLYISSDKSAIGASKLERTKIDLIYFNKHFNKLNMTYYYNYYKKYNNK